MARLSTIKKLTLLAITNSFAMAKRPGDDKIEMQFGLFGDPANPVQATPKSIKRLDGKYTYKWVPRAVDHRFVLVVEVEAHFLEDALTFILTNVIHFPKDAEKHFITGAGFVDIRSMNLDKSLIFNADKEVIEVPAESFTFA